MRRQALLAAIVVSLLLVSVGCNGSKPRSEQVLIPATDRLSQAIANAQGQVAPDGIEAGLWELLADELVRVLELRREGLLRAPSMLVPPPDFSVENHHVAWTQNLVGDYDNNGEVNVSDITQLAINFGRVITPQDLADSPIARVDGDRNGEINLADVSMIAVHYGETLTGYAVLSSETPGGLLKEVAILTPPFYLTGAGKPTPSYVYFPT